MIKKLTKQYELKKQLSHFRKMIKTAKNQSTDEKIKSELENVYIELFKFEQLNQDSITPRIKNELFSLYLKIDAAKVKCYHVCGKAWTDID